MNDKRFKLLLITAALTTIIVAFIWKYPEAAKVHESRLGKSSEYLYLDQRYIYHISGKCPKLNYKGDKSVRIERSSLNSLNLNFCPYCVSDKDYDAIRSEIVAREEEEERNKNWQNYY